MWLTARDELGDKPNPVVYSRYGKSTYSSSQFPYQCLEEFFEPSLCDLNKIPDTGTPYKAFLNYIKPGSKEGFHSLPKRYYSPHSPEDDTLVFESRFESGNLQLAIRKEENNYDLVLQNDINTVGHTQCRECAET